MRWNARTRIAVASVALGTVFTTFSARLIYLGVTKHDDYSELAARKNSIRQTIHATRGLIFDRNGEALAENAPIRTAFADGTHIKDPAALAVTAAPFLQMDEAELRAELTRVVNAGDKYERLKRGLPAENAIDLKKRMDEEGIRGIYFEHDSERVHPNGPMLSHVLGFLNYDREGVQGIEASMDNFLEGQDGFRHIEHDRTGKEIVVYRGQERAPRDGMNVTLTIDMGLQSIVEDELDAAFNELQPDTAVAVLVDPTTGEVLAMANRPSFDPDDIAAAEPEAMKNRAIIDMVEPGSIFKIVPTGGALNEGLVNTETSIYCEGGSFAYGGRILRDHHGYGNLNVHDIIKKSSNIGCAKLALKMGDNSFYEYVKRFGFGERTGIELPGEISGLVHPPAAWDKLTITRMPMGHAVAVTPIQMALAMGAVANGGKLMAPRVVKSISNSEDQVIKDFQPTIVREVINPETAFILNEALASVVGPGGTARLAAVPGYTVAGKTGTAEKVDPKGGYMAGKYVVSFVGYLPAEDPAFVCLVMIDNPDIPSHLNYGGLVAAPIFSRIGERAARHLDLQPIMRAEAVVASSKK
ncbi:MAG: penicillin-binding protein 2 [Chthoniobacterales bacterium]